MRRKRIGGDAVILIPATEDALTIGTHPAPDGTLAVVLTVDTENLGTFVIPLTASQLAVLAVVGRKLLTLNSEQVTELRAAMARTTDKENEQ